jgi:NAD(P)-dependent dehydrogenase (short-subunit alcohol dehydrogenase family)
MTMELQSAAAGRQSGVHGTTLIVGPGEHFGAELVAAFGRLSTGLVLAARNTAPLDELAREAQFDGPIRVAQVDVTDAPNLGQVLRETLEGMPPLRFVVYNVKNSPKGPAIDVGVDEFNDALAANLSGALATVQIASSVRREHPLVCVLTGGGFKDSPDENRLALSVSKAGLHSMARGLNQALRSREIQVKTLVVDGYVRREGPLRPAVVAEAMARLALDPARFVARIDLRAQHQENENQLGLFDGAGLLTA